jgi:hypothetical protein
MAEFCEHGNGTFGSVNSGEFLDSLSDYDLLKNHSTFCGELF